MHRLRLWTNILVMLLPLLILLGSATRFVQGIWKYLNSDARLAGVASVEATRALGREVRIGDVKITGNLWGLAAENRVELRNVSIPETEAGVPALASADRIDIKYNLNQILRPADPTVPLINGLHLVRPQAFLIRDRAGHWNFEHLLKKKGVSGRTFVDKLTFENGLVYYSDDMFPTPKGLPRTRFTARVDRLGGLALIRMDKSVFFDAAGVGEPDKLRDFRATGILDVPAGQAQAHLTASQVRLPLAASYLLLPRRGRVLTGMSDVDVDVVYTPPDKTPFGRLDPKYLNVHGNISLLDASVELPGLNAPVTGLKGTATFANGSVTADLAAQLAGASGTLHGTVFGLDWKSGKPFDPKHAAVALQGSLASADIGRFLNTFRLDRLAPQSSEAARQRLRQIRGQGSVQFQAAGSAANPSATLTGTFGTLRTGPYAISNGELRALYANRTLRGDIRADYAKGLLTARAEASPSNNWAFKAQLQGRKLNIASLGVGPKKPIGGSGDIDLIAEGARKQTPRITWQTTVHDLLYNKIALGQVYAWADTAGHDLLLRTLRVEDAKGVAVARGRIDLKSRALDIQVNADDLDFGKIADLAAAITSKKGSPPPPQIAGAGYLRGRLTGTMQSPRLIGTLTAFDVRANKADVDAAEADFDLSRQAFSITEGHLYRYPGMVSLAGAVRSPFNKDNTLNKNARLDVAGHADDFDISELIRKAEIDTGSVTIQGSLQGDLEVAGTLGKPLVSAENIRLQDAVVNGLAADKVAGSASYDDGLIRIGSLQADIGGGHVQVSGTVDKDRNLSLDVNATGLQLETLTDVSEEAPPVHLRGAVTLKGSISGTPTEPDASVSLSTNGLFVNNVQVGELNGSARYRDKRVTVENARLADAASGNAANVIDIPHFEYDTDSGSIVGQIKATDLALVRIRELARSSINPQTDAGQSGLAFLEHIQDPLQGALTATVNLSGTAQYPIADVAWNAQNLLVDGHRIATLAGTALVNKDEIVIPAHANGAELHLESPEAFIDANVNAKLNGEIDGEMRAYNVDLAFLKNWVDVSTLTTATQPDADPDVQEKTGRFVRGIGGKGALIYVTASGQTKSPSLEVSADFEDLTFEGRKILDRFNIARATIAEGSIDATGITLTRRNPENDAADPYRASARGSIGFSWKAPYIASDARLNLHAEVPKQSLRIIPTFLPGVLGGTEGTVAVSADVTGTRADPSVTGTLAVAAPIIRSTVFSTGLKNVDGLLAFKGDRLTVEKFTAQSQIFDRRTGQEIPGQTGGTLTMTGSLPLFTRRASNTDPGLTLSGSRILFAENPLPRITTGSARGEAEVDLALRGSAERPRLTGEVVLRNTLATLPRDFGGVGGAPVDLPIIPRFDLKLRLAENVRLINESFGMRQLDARADGTINLTGTFDNPNINGLLTLREGRMSLPTARFTLLQTGVPNTLRILYPVYAEETGSVPSMGIDVNLRAQTQSRISAVSLSGVRQSYNVIVTARGPITGLAVDPISGEPRLQLTFQTDPPDLAGNQQALFQRVAGLLGADAFSDIGRNPEQALASQLTNVFTSSVIPGLFDKPAEALGFDQLSLNYDSIQHLNLAVSRRLFYFGRYSGLYITYNRSLGGGTEMYNLKLSLRFRERYQFSFTSDEQQTQSILLEGVWKF